jgi:hypothetical protein
MMIAKTNEGLLIEKGGPPGGLKRKIMEVGGLIVRVKDIKTTTELINN